MSRLFIELYLDEDVDVLIATMLRARGFQAVTTQQVGIVGSSDEAQFVHAVSLGKNPQPLLQALTFATIRAFYSLPRLVRTPKFGLLDERMAI